jgi:hypothetical protein
MWDPRFPELAAARLQESHAQAAHDAQAGPAPSAFRLILGAALMRLGERLAGPVAAPVGRPATLAR